MTGRLSHVSGAGVVLVVDIMAEAGMLEGVFSLRGVDVGLRGTIQVDGLSFDDFGVSGWLREHMVGGVVLWSSQDATF